MKTNFVLIDYENVQPDDLSPLIGGPYEVRLFIGANQKSLRRKLVLSMQEMGEKAKYIEVNEIKDNAVDFHITYYLGVFSTNIKDVSFHIISKDKGYDPLITHLRQKKLADCHRFERLEDIPHLPTTTKTKPTAIATQAKAIATTSKAKPDGRVDDITEKLKKLKAARPRKLESLRATINSWLEKKISDEDFSTIVSELKVKKLIKETAGKITYTLGN